MFLFYLYFIGVSSYGEDLKFDINVLKMIFCRKLHISICNLYLTVSVHLNPVAINESMLKRLSLINQ